MSSDFDAASELEKTRELRRRRRMPNYWPGRSQLDKYAGELLQLHDEGASSNDLRVWLAESRKLRVNRSTISRWLTRYLRLREETERL